MTSSEKVYHCAKIIPIDRAFVYDNNFTLIIDITSMKHSLLQTFETGLALQSLDTLSDVRIKAFTLLF
jgi:hypothetical protein